MSLTETQADRRGHAFLTDEIRAITPDLYATEDVSVADKTITAHFFAGGADWWMIEMDKDEDLAFGYCDLGLGFPEWGYFNLSELETLVAMNGLLIVERDCHFTPTLFRLLDLEGATV